MENNSDKFVTKDIIKIREQIIEENDRESALLNELKKSEFELKKHVGKYNKISKEKEKYKQLSLTARQSKSWRILTPFRMVSKIIKKVRNLYSLNKSKDTLNPSSVNLDMHKSVTSKYSAKALEFKLLGGFSSYALNDLEELKRNEKIKVNERTKAAWSIMRWHFINREYEKALENLIYIDDINVRKIPSISRTIGKYRILYVLNRKGEAKTLLDTVIKLHGFDEDLYLAMSNLQGIVDNSNEDLKKLRWINAIYEFEGYAKIMKRDINKTLSIDNLSVDKNSLRYVDEADSKVTIIIPTFNAENTIGTAIESLINQTWRNIEVLVVDDCSTDRTVEVVSSYVMNDNRVVLIKKDINEGSYCARNTGLLESSGDYITVHDSDDWSHPQKIETQIQLLLKSEGKIGIITHWVRVLKDMTIVGSWFPRGSFFEMNFSSLLFHKDALKVLGGWDYVRVAGDSEFLWRFEKIFGEDSIIKYGPKTPLSFSLTSEESLTRAKATHVRSVKFGLRRIYREAAQWWHNKVESVSELYIDPKSRNRKFPSPVPNHNIFPASRKYDLVVVTDFNIQGGAYISTINYILAMLKLGKKVGIFHWRRYDLDVGKSLNEKVFSFIEKNNIDILVPGEEVSSNIILVGYPTILEHKIDDAPNIKFNELIVIVNQMSARLFSGNDVQYNPLVAKQNIDEVFGGDSKWVPISPLVKRLMLDDNRYSKPQDDIWYPMIDTDIWCNNELKWRGDSKKIPVVGRHGRDHYTKWPKTKIDIENAYCSNLNYEMRFLGGTQKALDLLGYTPENWLTYQFDSMDVKDFLNDLDFFIHYTHDDYIEEFGRAVMEAMAVGIPVILPTKFKETFGEAALYADSNKVSEIIDSVWMDRDLYLERAKIGREFVNENCSINKFYKRLERLNIN